MFLVVSLLFAGCKKDDKKTSQVMPEKPIPAGINESDLQLVSLSVPKMVWGFCAASVRGDLAKVDGIYEIKADFSSQTCEFKAAKDLDVKAKLTELAKTNEHLEDWSIVNWLSNIASRATYCQMR